MKELQEVLFSSSLEEYASRFYPATGVVKWENDRKRIGIEKHQDYGEMMTMLKRKAKVLSISIYETQEIIAELYEVLVPAAYEDRIEDIARILENDEADTVSEAIRVMEKGDGGCNE